MMAKLSDSEDIQCTGFDHDHHQEAACAYHEEHMMHDCVQLDHVVDSHDEYTHDSNIIMYDQYVRDNEVPVVHSGVSSVPPDAFMMIYDDMCEPHDQSVSYPSRNTVVKNSLTTELAIYKEHVELVAIGYKNPLCLTRAKQAQPALYNDHEIIKENHIQAIVHNSEDTLEIAEITRKKINDKMNDPECMNRKIKSEALKERTKVSRRIKAFTLYPPNTPAALVPKVLPTKSQVKILIFTLIQLFSEFDQTCKKRITPSAITDGERGFEQTKACYLQEVIPFFKTLKDNFEGIQKSLTKEVKEMKNVFEELESEIAQYVVYRKHDAIELKNLLIANDNLITECLSQEVFCMATNSELNIARFTGMHVANTTAEIRCPVLKAELANLRETKNQDNQTDLINHFLKLEVTHLQAQNDLFRAENNNVKQYYKQLYDFIKITLAKHIEQVTKLTAKNVTVRTSVSKAKDAHLDYLRHLKESVETIRDIVEETKVVKPLDRSIVSACRYTKHSQELLEYAIGTCHHGSQPRAKQLGHIPLIMKNQVRGSYKGPEEVGVL
nr:hypothetical protein [Tanacetum cinerariifolium]